MFRIALALALGCLFIPPTPVAASDVEKAVAKLNRESFARWQRWITSSDVDKRRDAARLLGGHPEQPGTVGLLLPALSDRDDVVRVQAASSLWKLAEREVDIGAAVPALRERLVDPRPDVRVQAAGALEKAGVDPRELVDARRSVLREGDWFEVALAARDLVGWVDGVELVEPLLRSLREAPLDGDRDRFDANRVFAPLVARGDGATIEALVAALDEPRLPKASLIAALGDLQPAPPGLRDALLANLREDDPAIRATAAKTLGALVQRGEGGDGWVAPLLPLLEDLYVDVRYEACDALRAGRGAAHTGSEALLALLAREPEARVRRAALRALAAIGDPAEAFDRSAKSAVAERALPAVEAIASGDADADVRETAQEALATLRDGTATGTRVLAPTAAPSDAGALDRLRARDIAFTEDSFWRAIGERDLSTIEDLLAAGISPTAMDASGMPALHFAVATTCDYGQPSSEATRGIIAALLRAGADPNQREADGGNTALHRATSCDAFVVKQLLAAKADPKAKNTMQIGAFTMFIGINAEAAKALLDAGYRADAKEKAMLQAMLSAEKDPGKRKLFQRALGGGGFDVE